MLAAMPARQFDDWHALYVSEPWGEERGDLQMARIGWATLRPHVKGKLKESDFLFKFGPPPPPPSPEEYRRKSMRAMYAHGGYHVDTRAGATSPGADDKS